MLRVAGIDKASPTTLVGGRSQWGHGLSAVEISLDADSTNNNDMLQWGHNS